MKKQILILIAAFAAAAAFAAGNVSKIIVTVHADGTCEITRDTTQPRAAAEMEARYGGGDMPDGMDVDVPDADTPPAQPVKKPDQKPLTDAELAAKVRDVTEKQYERTGDSPKVTIDTVEVMQDKLHMVVKLSFDSLEKMLATGVPYWSDGGVNFSNARFEKNDQGQLQVTAGPDARMKRYMNRGFRTQAKLEGGAAEFHLVLPGKVLSSSFTNVQDNATWLTVDPNDDASWNAAMKLYDSPAVITAELNGLKLDKPLDSKELQRNPGMPGTDEYDDIAVVNAPTGYTSEASSITTDTTYYFPGGEKYYKESEMNQNEPGVTVQVKLFAPRGRYFLSVSDFKVSKAVDDKGRAVKSTADGSESTSFMGDGGEMTMPGGREKPGAEQMEIPLRLALPERDAQSIAEVSGEAVAVTFSKWNEITVTNLAGTIDLSAIVPGASMTVTKLSAKNMQASAQVELKGSAAIRKVQVKAKTPGGPQMQSNSNSYETRYNKGKGDNDNVRKINVQSFVYNMQGGANPAISTNDVTLVVRIPDDVKRERVPIKVTALDLF